jgi:Spy/CpxP family protein refolding chaperone
MRTKRTEILIILVAALAMSAGVVAGLLASRLPANAGRSSDAGNPASTTPPPASFERTLADELALRDDQREQMRQIWEGVRARVHKTFDDAQNLQRERDEAMVALLNDEQRVKFAKISQDYAGRFSELTKRRDATFEEAVEKTKQMLDPLQRAKYQEILKAHVRRGPPAGIPPPPGPPPETPRP